MIVSRQAEAAADDWLGRLGGEESTHPDREAFERWRADPVNAAAYAQAWRLWTAAEDLRARPEVLALTAQALAETEPRSRPATLRRPVLALAASLGVCLIAGGAFVLGKHYLPAQTYTTEFGERSTVRLKDGSTVILNSATRLEVTFGEDRRAFRLKQGEALFAVAEDAARPFTVSTQGGTITALGTRFQVRSDTSAVLVTLLEGRIAVDRAATGEYLQLQPGEQVRFRGDGPLARRAVDLESVTSWTTGRLRFNKAPLAEVLDEVNRYSKTRISLADPALGATPVNATFDMGDSASVVDALQLFLPLEVLRRGRDEVVLAEKR